MYTIKLTQYEDNDHTCGKNVMLRTLFVLLNSM